MTLIDLDYTTFDVSEKILFITLRLCPNNPLMPVAISKPLEIIGKSTYILACSIATAPDSDINQTAGSGGHLSM